MKQKQIAEEQLPIQQRNAVRRQQELDTRSRGVSGGARTPDMTASPDAYSFAGSENCLHGLRKPGGAAIGKEAFSTHHRSQRFRHGQDTR